MPAMVLPGISLGFAMPDSLSETITIGLSCRIPMTIFTGTPSDTALTSVPPSAYPKYVVLVSDELDNGARSRAGLYRELNALVLVEAFIDTEEKR